MKRSVAADLHELRLLALRPGERLEVALTFAPGCRGEGALLLSPQPFLGGDMDNNVILALAQALALSAHPVLRFNYRSVGRSAAVDPQRSRYDYWNEVMAEGRFAATDADAAEAYARASRLFRPVLLAGYSFGAHVALRLALALPVAPALVLVAPPLGQLDFAGLNRVGRGALVVLAGEDVLDPAPPAEELARRLPGACCVRLPGADHFFRGREDELAQVVLNRLESLSGKDLPGESPCCRS